MKLFAIVLVFGMACADKLDRTYLPPSSAGSAGGNGNFLATPNRGSFAGSFGGSSASRGAAGSDHNAAAAAIATVRLNNDANIGDGSYRFDYETQNQIKHEESGELRNAGSQDETTVVRGSYSFVGPDGVTYTVNYVADENGFQASGAHLPVAPEIPEAIQRSIQQNQLEEQSGGSGSGNYGGNNGNNQGGYQGYQSNRPNNVQAPRPFSAPAQKPNRQYGVPANNPNGGYNY